MTNEEAIKILEQIRQWTDYPKEALTMAIEALSKSSLPSNLDEAADYYKDTVTPEEVDDSEHAYSYETYTEYQIADAFKAGAEWMAGRGETEEGVFRAGDPGYPDVRMGEQYSIEHILRKPGGIEPGDEVIVQSRTRILAGLLTRSIKTMTLAKGSNIKWAF